MQLTKLELFGFKSFAGKTEFAFSPGITVVVGPNGCGKSNVVDAVKWVLGEQGTKTLRANEMIDVIFSGNDSRPSLGYAEVSATISNNKGLLPLEYQEVCITRRLYASGESEYYINKQLCRLRDIKDLLLDTGLGTNCYSLIEQGEVDLLLQANAQERRSVFEEAAGISKYKVKKKAAMSKLEKIEQNLLRLNDIVEEVQKQSRSVKLQAAKARKYQEYTQRLKELKVQWALKNFLDLEADKSQTTARIEEVSNQDRNLLRERESLEREKTALEEKIQQRGREISQIHSQLVELEAQVYTTEDKISLETQRVEELELQKARLAHQLQSLQGRVKELRDQHLNIQESITAAEEEIHTLQELLVQREDELHQVEQESTALQQEIEKKKAQAIETLQRHSHLQNHLANITHERETLENRKSRLEERLRGLSQELESLASSRKVLDQEREVLNQKIKELEEGIKESTSKEETLKGQTLSLEEKLSQKRHLLTAKQSRQEALKDFEARAVGIETGTKTLLEEARKEESNLSGIHGILADMVKVDLPNALAVEAALGLKVQALITQSTQDALCALGHLENTQKGRATLFPLDRQDSGANGLAVPQEEGVIAKALDLINCSEPYNHLLNKLLEKTIVVKDLATGLQLSRNCPEARLVTLKGELIEPDGSISGGGGPGQPGIISRRSELEGLEGEISLMAQEVQSLGLAKGELEKECKDLQETIAALEGSLQECQRSLLTREKEIHEQELRLKLLGEERDVNSAETLEISTLLEKLSQRDISLRRELEEVLTLGKEIEREINTSTLEFQKRQSRRAELEGELTELKVKLASKKEKRQGLGETLNYLERSIKESEVELTNSLQEIKGCEERKAQAQRDIESLSIKVKELKEKKDGLFGEKVAKEEEEKVAQAHLSQILQGIQEKEQVHSTLREQLQELRLKEKEFEIKRSDLLERVREEYQVELSSLQKAEIDWSIATPEMEELRTKIERLGHVNLEALEELDQLEIREQFLLNQREDLVKAKNSLTDIIRKINQTSRELFQKSFEDIRENFNAMFRKLFGGGKAHIYLEEGVDILDAGVEIVAQPPGKELRSISLLSGGEKAMTAVALLFAIFQIKPSPFCILDEVDAALDESNINRFTHVLKEFAEHSQFIVITHNKRTMTEGDTLYGITMEESGISKKIAIKLENIRLEKGTSKKVTALEETEEQKTLSPPSTQSPPPVYVPGETGVVSGA